MAYSPSYNPLADLNEAPLPIDEMVKAIRSRLGVLQDELAEAMGVTRTAISHIETGATKAPQITTLYKLAEAAQRYGGYISVDALRQSVMLSTRTDVATRDTFLEEFEAWYQTLPLDLQRRVRFMLDTLRALVEAAYRRD